MNCECIYWARTDSFNGITKHHPNCENYKEPKIWGYRVDNNETDFVFAESEDDAINISRKNGCHCDSEEKLIVKKMTLKEMAEVNIYDECSGQYITMLQDFRYNQARRICCSTVW